MGYSTSEDQTAHGFRATARTILVERLGWHEDIVELQLDHVVRDSNGRAYNRTELLKDRRKMMQAWSDYLDALKSGRRPPDQPHHGGVTAANLPVLHQESVRSPITFSFSGFQGIQQILSANLQQFATETKRLTWLSGSVKTEKSIHHGEANDHQ